MLCYKFGYSIKNAKFSNINRFNDTYKCTNTDNTNPSHYRDAQALHAVDMSFVEVESHGAIAHLDFDFEVLNQFRAVIAAVVGQNVGDLSERFGIGLDGDGGLALHGLSQFVNGRGAAHLRVSTAVQHAAVFDRVHQNADSVVEGTLGFVKDVLRRPTQH